MKAFVISLLFSFLTMLPAQASSNWNFISGQKLSHSLSVCLTLADAKAVLEADVTKGQKAAEEAFNSFEKCRGSLVVQGPKVGKVVASGEVIRDDEKVILRIVEIIEVGGKEVIGYFFTSRKVIIPGRI